MYSQVVAVAARKLGYAQEFAKKHNIARAYGGYEDLARDPDIGELLSVCCLAGGTRCKEFAASGHFIQSSNLQYSKTQPSVELFPNFQFGLTHNYFNFLLCYFTVIVYEF